jgi:hypothetical protein
MISIQQSILASYFDAIQPGDPDIRDVLVLDPQEAKSEWGRLFAAGSKGLHDLPDDCWVQQCRWKNVGNWINSYNGLEDPLSVVSMIQKESGWEDDQALLLVQGGVSMVTLPFRCFGHYWQDLFAAYDDGPILLKKGELGGIAFRFVPMGHILLCSHI